MDQSSGLVEQGNAVMEQLLGVLDAITPGGRTSLSASNVVGGLVAGLSMLRLVTTSVDEALALIPHHTVFSPFGFFPIPFLWNVATAHFFEANLVKAIIVTPCVVILTRLLERLWSAKAIFVHILFTVACSGFMFFAAELIHVYRTRHEKDFFIPVRGCAGLLVALAIGVRHAYPLEALPLLPRALGLQYQHLPFCLTGLSCAFGFLAPGLLPDWPFAPTAFFFGWLHVRYLMWFPNVQAHGDHSPEFLFASLFPRPFQPLVGCFGAMAHCLVALAAPSFVQLRQAPEGGSPGHSIVYDPARAVEAGGAGFSSGFSGAGVADPSAPVVPGGPGSKEYAARRAKALALLDQNINSLLAPQAGGGGPSEGTELSGRAPALAPAVINGAGSEAAVGARPEEI